MAQNNMFQGEMDPEIAALLGTDTQSRTQDHVPDFSDLFSDSDNDEIPVETEDGNILSAGFPEITRRLEEEGHAAFDDPNYYKTALSGEGNIAQRVHTILQKYLNAKDPKDKSVFRQQLIPIFWEFLSHVAHKSPGRLPDPKKYLLRYSILHPTFLEREVRTFFSQIIVENTHNQPVYYLDEWFKAVGTGMIRNSSTDEVRVVKTSNSIKYSQLLEKSLGKLDGTKVLLRTKDEERHNFEKNLLNAASLITQHFPVTGLPEISSCYSESQKRNFFEIQEICKFLIKADRDHDLLLKDYFEAEQNVSALRQRLEQEGGTVEVDVKAVDTEIDTVRQMVKMTIGRQGNHFPVLTSEYFHSIPSDVGTRENVISILNWIESIDAEAYCRSYKNRLNRIVPYVLLVPTYGDAGMCWEPFDRFNRASSRGRIAIPMYPKNLQIAVLSAVADLRWQVAKEKASYYWMEEGLTGNYYQYFQKMKLRGDVKDYFIQDYITWMTKESD